MMFSTVEPVLMPVMATFAALVAVSRVILGLHYPSDVVVGALIGASLATTSISLM
jgi:undecaprenyl-diphosphatase